MTMKEGPRIAPRHWVRVYAEAEIRRVCDGAWSACVSM